LTPHLQSGNIILSDDEGEEAEEGEPFDGFDMLLDPPMKTLLIQLAIISDFLFPSSQQTRPAIITILPSTTLSSVEVNSYLHSSVRATLTVLVNSSHSRSSQIAALMCPAAPRFS
jgi:hypothetical protein